MKLKVQFVNYDAVAANALDEPVCMFSDGQEKELRELSITPVGYFTGAIKNHSCAVSHRNYFAWRK
jgi:hypothetical protein